jgi:hypothetical protein
MLLEDAMMSASAVGIVCTLRIPCASSIRLGTQDGAAEGLEIFAYEYGFQY